MNKVLVLTSGGLDSTVCLYKAISQVGKSNVYMLNMYYGQKHDIEIEQARWQAKHLGLEDHYIEKDISTIFAGLENSSALLKGSNKEIAHESYADQLKNTDVVSAYVPYRNGIFLSIAAGIAYSLGCDTVAYGAHADDAVQRQSGDDDSGAYPDCTPSFIMAQAEAIEHGTAGKVTLWAPLWKLNKKQVIMEGVEALMTREEFSHTHSCYEGVPGGCGTCGTCYDVREGLDANDHTRGIIQDGKAF